MNRSIKFRVWNISKKRWENKLYLYLDDSKIGDVSEAFHNEDDTESYILNQFTGLRDKNKKEIYEGDIVFITEYETKKYKVVDDEVCWFQVDVKIIGEVRMGKHSATCDDPHCAGSAYGWYLYMKRFPKDEYRESILESLDNEYASWSPNENFSTKTSSLKIIGNIHENKLEDFLK